MSADDAGRICVSMGTRFVGMGTDIAFLLEGARQQASVVQASKSAA